ncbi:MAG: beta-agarase [Verrucomicrobia bacterium]|nr:MAG: beta-agarase [Verrucomicrobiota bacterium]
MTRKILKTLALLFALATVMATPALRAADAPEAPRLPPDAQRTKAHLELLFSIADRFNARFIEHINTGEKRIQAIDVPGCAGPVEGEVRVPLSPELVQVLEFFRVLEVRGEGLTAVDLFFWNGAEEMPLTYWAHRDNYIAARRTTMQVRPDQYEGCELIFRGRGTVAAVQLFQDHGVSPVFNDEAWGIVGGRRPILKLKASVDTGRRRSIDGVTRFEEEKFKRVYAGIDGGYEDNPEAWEAARFYKSYGFFPGRQIAKLGPELEHAYGYSDRPLMREDPARPGWSDYSFFEQNYLLDPELIAKIDRFWPRDLKFAMCLNNWPSWMEPEGLNIRNDMGTPAPELFDAAADLAARYIAAYRRMEGRVAQWWEVKNESTIKHEWMFHNEPGYDSWGLLAEFHNVVADRIKASFPEIKVGGPTSAWMALDVNDFALARDQMRFMDLTRDHLDFYSHHFYEGKELVINDPARDSNSGTYLSGRLIADLDLLQNHMALTDNWKPMIISETGSLHEGDRDLDHWILLKNFNSLMIRYMNRANEFKLVVPFLIPVTWWDHDARHYLMRYREDGSIEPTHQAKFLELWAPYRGELLPVQSSSRDLTLHAVADGNIVQVAINNMHPQRASVDLDVDLHGRRIRSILQTRLYLEYGRLEFRTEELPSLEAIPVAVEETTIVRIELDAPPELRGTLLEKTFYGDATLLPTGEPARFRVQCPTEGLERARLRVCFGRDHGFSEPLTVSMNGQTWTEDLSYSNLTDRFFSYAEFDVPVDAVSGDNEIVVTIPQAGGRISSVALVNGYRVP